AEDGIRYFHVTGVQACALPISDTASAMVEMQMGKQYIGDVGKSDTGLMKRLFQRMFAVQIIVTEEFLALLIAHSRVDQDQSVPILHQQAAGRPAAHVILIGRIGLFPDRLRYNAKHGPPVKFEMAGMDRK